MTSFALMFRVLEGGMIDPIKWTKDSFAPDTSIIVLDEDSESVYLWHGVKQGLVARRTALRQAESLKGHGYTVGKSIIGRDIKSIKEIDARKVGKVPEDTQLNDELQAILDAKFTELDNFIITFQEGGVAPSVIAPAIREQPKPSPKPEPKPQPISAPKPQPVSVPKPQPVSAPKPQPVSAIKPQPLSPAPISKPEKVPQVASEYTEAETLPSIKPTPKPTPSIQVTKTSLETDAKISFVFSAILDHFDDIWISKKKDGTYSVEEMDGPICAFSVKEGKINFTADSYRRIDPKIKITIQKKFIELSKLF